MNGKKKNKNKNKKKTRILKFQLRENFMFRQTTAKKVGVSPVFGKKVAQLH